MPSKRHLTASIIFCRVQLSAVTASVQRIFGPNPIHETTPVSRSGCFRVQYARKKGNQYYTLYAINFHVDRLFTIYVHIYIYIRKIGAFRGSVRLYINDSSDAAETANARAEIDRNENTEWQPSAVPEYGNVIELNAFRTKKQTA